MILAAAVTLGGVLIMIVSRVIEQRNVRRDLEIFLDRPHEKVRRGVAAHEVADNAVGLAGRLLSRFDAHQGLASNLDRARIPLKPAEFVIVALSASLVAAALVHVMSGANPVASLVAGILTLAGSFRVVKARIARRRKAFEAQLPQALTLIASSLAAGHTFLRSLQMMVEEARPPLSEEFGRVVAETRLGATVVDALDRMAQRLDIRDLEWVVQAIRIQQTVGGRLADLLHTLAEFIRARDEVRREVDVLTAEGRISAWFLAGLPPLLLLAMRFLNPVYSRPLFSGVGLFILGFCTLSVGLGTFLILRMVKIKV